MRCPVAASQTRAPPQPPVTRWRPSGVYVTERKPSLQRKRNVPSRAEASLGNSSPLPSTRRSRGGESAFFDWLYAPGEHHVTSTTAAPTVTASPRSDISPSFGLHGGGLKAPARERPLLTLPGSLPEPELAPGQLVARPATQVGGAGRCVEHHHIDGRLADVDFVFGVREVILKLE